MDQACPASRELEIDGFFYESSSLPVKNNQKSVIPISVAMTSRYVTDSVCNIKS